MKKNWFNSLLVATFVVASAVLLTVTGVDAANADVVFAGGPSTSDGHIDPTRSIFNFLGKPADQFSDKYYVTNLGSTEIQAVIFAANATTDQNGSAVFADRTDTTPGVANWIKFSNGTNQIALTLAPHSHKILDFTVSFPADAAPGDHGAGLVMEAHPLQSTGQITVSGRVVSKLYARVNGDLRPNLSISSIQTSYHPFLNPFLGDLTEKFTITNSGNVAMSATINNTATGIFGLPLSARNSWDIPEIFPGTSRDIDVTIHGVGQWLFMSASVELVPHLNKGALKVKNLQSVSRSDAVWIFPTTWFILAVIALIVWFSVRRNLSKRKLQVTRWLQYTEEEARRRASSD
jgi:dihydroorotate dehydrogenase (fumarate)